MRGMCGMEVGGTQQTQQDKKNRGKSSNIKENSINEDAANKCRTIKKNLEMLNCPHLQGGRQAQLL